MKSRLLKESKIIILFLLISSFNGLAQAISIPEVEVKDYRIKEAICLALSSYDNSEPIHYMNIERANSQLYYSMRLEAGNSVDCLYFIRFLINKNIKVWHIADIPHDVYIYGDCPEILFDETNTVQLITPPKDELLFDSDIYLIRYDLVSVTLFYNHIHKKIGCDSLSVNDSFTVANSKGDIILSTAFESGSDGIRKYCMIDGKKAVLLPEQTFSFLRGEYYQSGSYYIVHERSSNKYRYYYAPVGDNRKWFIPHFLLRKKINAVISNNTEDDIVVVPVKILYGRL